MYDIYDENVEVEWREKSDKQPSGKHGNQLVHVLIFECHNITRTVSWMTHDCCYLPSQCVASNLHRSNDDDYK